MTAMFGCLGECGLVHGRMMVGKVRVEWEVMVRKVRVEWEGR